MCFQTTQICKLLSLLYLQESVYYRPIGVISTLTQVQVHIRDHFVSLTASSFIYRMYTSPERQFFLLLHFILDNKPHSTVIEQMQPSCTQFQYLDRALLCVECPMQSSIKSYLIKSYKVIHAYFKIQT